MPLFHGVGGTGPVPLFHGVGGTGPVPLAIITGASGLVLTVRFRSPIAPTRITRTTTTTVNQRFIRTLRGCSYSPGRIQAVQVPLCEQAMVLCLNGKHPRPRLSRGPIPRIRAEDSRPPRGCQQYRCTTPPSNSAGDPGLRNGPPANLRATHRLDTLPTQSLTSFSCAGAGVAQG